MDAAFVSFRHPGTDVPCLALEADAGAAGRTSADKHVLKRYDGVSFPKALGTVVTERAIDSLLVMIITGLTILFQMSTFGTFFEKTGTSLDTIFKQFSPAGYFVTAVCGVAALLLVHLLLKRLSIYNKVKTTLTGIWQGVLSMKNVKNVPLFIFYTLAIWGSYFLHYYLTFFCFDFTENLGLGCALVTFIVGTIAVIVPTPNGAGPWSGRCKSPLFRAHCPHSPNHAGHRPRHLFRYRPQFY